MDLEFLMLLALGLIVLGPISFFMALAARSRMTRQTAEIRVEVRALHDWLASVNARMTILEDRLDTNPVGSEPTNKKSDPEGQPEGLGPPVRDAVGANIRAAHEGAPAGQSALKLPPIAHEPAIDTQPAEPVVIPEMPSGPGAHRTIEEILGTRWTVWVGGLALALGALLLVRYSIERGFFGPSVRTIMGFYPGARACRRRRIPAPQRKSRNVRPDLGSW
jgi:uncharacterized membrane protein